MLFMGGSTATAAPDDRPAHIVGHVRNSATGEFLPRVLVTVKGHRISVSTDVTGHFMLKNLPIRLCAADTQGYNKTRCYASC